MKKYMLTLAIALLGISQMFALSTSSIRNHARFLTDRMAYELDLTAMQYDDIYEINFNYIYQIDRIMDDVVYGYRDAIDEYYDLLDDRNDDIRYVLRASQYRKFMGLEYFYRPAYSTGRNWSLRIYTIYSNRNFFYYDAPVHYKTYAGAHRRKLEPNYYAKRYEDHRNDRFEGAEAKIKGGKSQPDIQRNDFGANVRERNNEEHNKVNNYKNPNSTNRTDNKYYQDNSGNKQAQEINNRNRKSVTSSSSSSSSSSSKSSSSASTSRSSSSSSKSSSSATTSRSNSSSSRSTSGTSTSRSSSSRSSSSSSSSTRSNSGSSSRSGQGGSSRR